MNNIMMKPQQTPPRNITKIINFLYTTDTWYKVLTFSKTNQVLELSSILTAWILKYFKI